MRINKGLFAFFTLLSLLLGENLVTAVGRDALLFTPDEKRPIVVDNRILAKVNGNAISVIDIMKKMDMLFYSQYPEYTSSSMARFQFYEANWEAVLQDLIDKELIIADSEESKMEISHGDIRQEMENLFGPNIIANLDKVGLTFDEAWKMVKNDIIMRRMLFVKAHSKALKQVTPEVIRKAYYDYAQANIRPTVWVYQVISIRDKDGERASTQAHRLLKEEKVPVTALTEKMDPSTKLTVSEEYRHTDNEVSEAYKEHLAKLQPGLFSDPIALKSRADNSIVYRIFYLKEKIPGGMIPYSEIGIQIKERLLNDAAMLETDKYLLKLRKHFDVQAAQINELKAEGFAPFKLS
ncbi:MAG: peptidyl-prolyl cis-trans isomerase [Parachlamydia sp.]|nr:peptidyl-prolyl cis-trans isomerase [Parachlamydia sp.]